MNDQELLDLYAMGEDGQQDRYWLSNPEVVRPRDETLKIINTCLALNVRVTDTITTDAWYEVVNRLLALEARINGNELSG